MKGEHKRSYGLFCIYRDLGAKRSMNAVREACRREGRLAGQDHIRELFNKYNWEERARLFDSWLDQQMVEERNSAIKDMTRRHAERAMQFQEMAFVPLKALLERMKDKPTDFTQVQKMEVFDLLRMMKEFFPQFKDAVTIERTARGEASEIIKMDMQEGDLAKKMLEDNDTFEAYTLFLQKITATKKIDAGEDDATTITIPAE
jgi:hypothetical protein